MHDKGENLVNSDAARENETRLKLFYEIGRILTISKTVKHAVPPILEAICQSLRFEVGELWILDETEKRLKLKSGWHAPGAPLERFAADSRAFEFAVGEGLPGTVWQSDAPVWIEKIGGKDNMPRRLLAERAGLRSAFAFPVRLGDKFLGAFCFLCRNACPRDEELMEMFGAVGGSVGQLIERERVEKTLRESEDRYRAFIKQSSEGIWRFELDESFSIDLPVDEQVASAFRLGYIAECNDAMARMYGLEKAEALVGVRVAELLDQADAENVSYIRDFIESEYYLTDGESRERDVNGAEKIFLNSLIGIVENDCLIRVWGTRRDITAQKRAEEKLRESDAVLQTINQSSPTLIFLKDLDGRMLNANPATLDVLGKTPFEVIGKTHGEYTRNEIESRQIAANDRRIVEGGATETFEEKILTKGAPHTFLSTKTPYRNERGEIIGLVGVSFDITTRKQAESRLALLAEISELIRASEETETLLFAVSEKIGEHLHARRCLFNEINLELDTETVHRDYCRGVESVAGQHRISAYSSITSAEMIGGATVVNDDSKTDPRTAGDYEKTYAPAGERAYVAVPLLRENRWVASLWISDDEPRRWSRQEISLLETVAERTWTAVEKLRIDAARRAAEAERELMFVEAQKAREIAERANHSKDEFIALVSHELRSPLNAMLGWTRILQKQQADEKTTEYALDVIVRNALSQSRLIEDLLDIARIGEGKLRIEMRATAVIPIIRAAVEIIKPAADAKHINIAESFDQTANFIHGDDDRLRQVLENLLSNAVKFTPPNGKIEIALRRGDQQVQIVLSDTGQGIPAEFLPQVFEKFRQADPSTTRRHGGLGIGLSLARDLVELHGGTISAASEGEGAGATFIVTLPLRKVLPIKRNSNTEGAMSSQGKLHGFWVLAVDDEADAREIVSFMLQINGAKVTTANSAVEALEILSGCNGRPPDILLSDISMPFESGYALLQKVRALPHEHGGDIPAVALTAFNRPEDREAAFEAGFQKHLGKPVDMDVLIDVIIETARAHQA